MNLRYRGITALLCLLLADGALAAVGRYRITLNLPPHDDPAQVARQLEAMTRGRIESSVEDGSAAFVLVASDAAVTAIAAYPKVARVEALPPARSAGSPATWTGTYAYDGSGNIKSITRSNFTEQYIYDAFGRLTSGTVSSGRSQSYTYDRFGNMLSIKTDNSTVTLGIDSKTNRMSISGPAYNITATYDDAGRLIAVPSLGYKFLYDGLDTLIESTVGERKVHLYTANGERVASVSIANGSPSMWEWTIRDPSAKVLRRFTRNGTGPLTWTEDYVYLGVRMLAAEVAAPERRRQFHLDHIGTPRLITGNGGAQVGFHTYFPFGSEATASIQEGERKQFTGHERDNAAVDYLHARYYSPAWGRFLVIDPANSARPGRPQTWNRYAYALNNPLILIDPNGEEGIHVIAVWAAGDVHPPLERAIATRLDSIDVNYVRADSTPRAVIEQILADPTNDVILAGHGMISPAGTAVDFQMRSQDGPTDGLISGGYDVKARTVSLVGCRTATVPLAMDGAVTTTDIYSNQGMIFAEQLAIQLDNGASLARATETAETKAENSPRIQQPRPTFDATTRRAMAEQVQRTLSMVIPFL